LAFKLCEHCEQNQNTLQYCVGIKVKWLHNNILIYKLMIKIKHMDIKKNILHICGYWKCN